jgi:hypothetical protein
MGSDGFVYVLDRPEAQAMMYNRIQKFTPEGRHIVSWAVAEDVGYADLAVDPNGIVYVADRGYNRVIKVYPDAELLQVIVTAGSGVGQVVSPRGIGVDAEGCLLVADTGNDRIQKFTSDGVFISEAGGFGYAPGQMNSPFDVATRPDGCVGVVDTQHNRVQVFCPVSVPSNAKALVVAGGGPENNPLWDATAMSVNFAYRALTYQGFTKESIRYLSSDLDLDLDDNGESDDVDGLPTLANLEEAITSWASDADSLVVYLCDHGGPGVFRLSATEMLEASALDAWLDALQGTMPGEVLVVVDACHSGSLVPPLTPPAGTERVVVASCEADESAYFVTNGSVSFSNFFWTHVFNGLDVHDATTLASQAISDQFEQHPVVDADGDGVGNEAADLAAVQGLWIGNGTDYFGEAPVVGGISPPQTISGVNAALLYAEDVTDTDGVARVWAVFRPPDYQPGSMDNPVLAFPSCDLMPVGDDRWEATWEGFSIPGTYQVAIYARDGSGNTSVPLLTTVTVENPLERKAVIVAGGEATDPRWPAFEAGACLAYEALRFQGYADAEIYYLSPAGLPGVDGTPTRSNVAYALSTWAMEACQDVVVYLVGEGGDGTFRLNAGESLSAADVDGWLDVLQGSIPGKVTVVYDGDRSGSFLPVLTPPVETERIAIASTRASESARFLLGGTVSFSRFFWTEALNGATVLDAFRGAYRAMSFAGGSRALLDDDGSGTGNERTDGVLARSYRIGTGIMLAGDPPIIGSVVAPQELDGDTEASLWADEVTTTGTIESVWAVITPPWRGEPVPSPEPVVVELDPGGEGHQYGATWDGFTTWGTYEVTFFAMDDEGNVSEPVSSEVTQTVGPDVYEDDDTSGAARVIVVGAEDQEHTIHDAGDVDWATFYALEGETYEFQATNVGASMEAVLELYEGDGETPLAGVIDDPFDEGWKSWTCPAGEAGVYYIRVTPFDPGTYGSDTEYLVRAYVPEAPDHYWIVGMVQDARTGEGLEGLEVWARDPGTGAPLWAAVTFPEPEARGFYMLTPHAGTYDVTATVPGYEQGALRGITVGPDNQVVGGQNLELMPRTLWGGTQDDHWENADNWWWEGSAEAFVPGPGTVAVLDGSPVYTPVLYEDESAWGMEFGHSGWTVGAAGCVLTVGSAGIDSAGAGTNTVDPNVALAEDATWTVDADNTLVLNGALSGNDHTLTKEGDGTLVLEGGQDHAAGLSLAIDGGTVRLGDGETLVLDALAINASLDLTTGHLVVDYEADSPFDEIAGWVADAYNGGAWDGEGITCEGDTGTWALGVADNDDPDFPTRTDLGGQTVDASSVLVRYTFYGNANLDDRVDAADLSKLLGHFGDVAVNPADVMGWFLGNFNYDDRIDAADLSKLLGNWDSIEAGGDLGGGAVLLTAPASGASAALLHPASSADGVLSWPTSGAEEGLMAADGTDDVAGEPADTVLSPVLTASLAAPAQTPTPRGLPAVSAQGGASPWQRWLPQDDADAENSGSTAAGNLTDPLAVPALDVTLGV